MAVGWGYAMKTARLPGAAVSRSRTLSKYTFSDLVQCKGCTFKTAKSLLTKSNHLKEDCMSAKIINGNEVSQQMKDEMKEEVVKLKAKGLEPALAVILVGEDPASKVYVANKKKACEYIGIKFSGNQTACGYYRGPAP